jgi:hypothetical protein
LFMGILIGIKNGIICRQLSTQIDIWIKYHESPTIVLSCSRLHSWPCVSQTGSSSLFPYTLIEGQICWDKERWKWTLIPFEPLLCFVCSGNCFQIGVLDFVCYFCWSNR